MALRIEKAFGVNMDTLMPMQASYDIAQTRKRQKQIHVRRITRLRTFTHDEWVAAILGPAASSHSPD